MNLYFIKIDWYDNYADKDCRNVGFVLAADLTDAAAQVSKDFMYVNNIEFELINKSANIIYVPDDDYLIQKIKDENYY